MCTLTLSGPDGRAKLPRQEFLVHWDTRALVSSLSI
jgi:hypothetical protein